MKRLTPLKAIRAKCLDCSAGQPSEIRNCVITICPLYPYRFGKNPNRKGIGNLKAHFSQKTQTQVKETEANYGNR
jgi:hypothetical protein